MKQIAYDKELHGTFCYPEGFAAMLEGRTVAEQLNFFRAGNGLYRKLPVSERRKVPHSYSGRLENEPGVETLLLHEGKIAGIMVRDYNGRLAPCLPEYGWLIRDDCETDGSGEKEYQLYCYLICVSEHFDEAEG